MAIAKTIRARGTRSTDLLERDFAEALRVIAASLRAGDSMCDAFGSAAKMVGLDHRTGQCLKNAECRMLVGEPPIAAIRKFSHEMGIGTADLFFQVVRSSFETGVDPGASCHRLATLLGERIRLRSEARTATSQARFSARAVVAMPVVAAALWLITSPESAVELVTGASVLLFVPSALLLAAGIAVVRRIAVDAEGLTGDTESRRPDERVSVGGSEKRAAWFVVRVTLPCLAVVVYFQGIPSIKSFLAITAGGVLAALYSLKRDAKRSEEHAAALRCELPHLFETTIALISAGSTARTAAVGAIEACPRALGRTLSPAAAQIRLGREPTKALLAVSEAAGIPELDAWAHSIVTASRTGADVVPAIEALLRDARSVERETFRTRAANASPRMQLAVVLLFVPSIMWMVLVVTIRGLAGGLSSTGVL